jgi:hypothetical protein
VTTAVNAPSAGGENECVELRAFVGEREGVDDHLSVRGVRRVAVDLEDLDRIDVCAVQLHASPPEPSLRPVGVCASDGELLDPVGVLLSDPFDDVDEVEWPCDAPPAEQVLDVDQQHRVSDAR